MWLTMLMIDTVSFKYFSDIIWTKKILGLLKRDIIVQYNKDVFLINSVNK